MVQTMGIVIMVMTVMIVGKMKTAIAVTMLFLLSLMKMLTLEELMAKKRLMTRATVRVVLEKKVSVPLLD